METKQVRIVDYGRGPQIENHRLTVMDVFYYLYRGRDFDFIHRAMPSLTREEFDAVEAYVTEHRSELEEQDRRVEERIRRELAEQKAKGFAHELDRSIPVEERAAQLKERVQCLKDRAEKTGDSTAG
jgi:uncharacterized protein (DUF433 family)